MSFPEKVQSINHFSRKERQNIIAFFTKKGYNIVIQNFSKLYPVRLIDACNNVWVFRDIRRPLNYFVIHSYCIHPRARFFYFNYKSKTLYIANQCLNHTTWADMLHAFNLQHDGRNVRVYKN